MDQHTSGDLIGEAMVLHISEPLKIHITAQNALEVLCYQKIAGQIDAVPMVFQFDPGSAGQLIGALNHAVQCGVITLEKSMQGSGLQ